MRKGKLLTRITVVLGVLSLVCLVGYYLALHDIFQDYVSPKALQEQAKLAPDTLPSWITCSLEWRVVGIGFWLMLAFHIVFLASVVWHAKRGNEGIPNQAHEMES